MIRAAALTLGILLLAGCSESDNRACTLIGGINGVDLDFTDLVASHPKQRLRVEVCAGDVCDTLKVNTARRYSGSVAGAASAGLKDEGSVEVTVKVLDESGQQVFDGTTEVTPTKFTPNGPGCDPTVFRARVVATGTATLDELAYPADMPGLARN